MNTCSSNSCTTAIETTERNETSKVMRFAYAFKAYDLLSDLKNMYVIDIVCTTPDKIIFNMSWYYADSIYKYPIGRTP